MRRLSVLFSLMAALVVTGCSSQSEEVNVYSARKEALIKPLLDRFTSETGITVNLITGSADALVERMKAEGEHSPADVLITTDAGRLYRAQQEGQLATTESDTLAEQVPEALRDPEGHWYGLSVRARVVVYAPDRVDPSELSTYEALADEKWDDRICIRSSDNIYNQSLTASLIAQTAKRTPSNGPRAWCPTWPVIRWAATATRSRPWPPASATSPWSTPTTWA